MTCGLRGARSRFAARQPDDPGFCQRNWQTRSTVLQSLPTLMRAKARGVAERDRLKKGACATKLPRSNDLG